jgi:hypothetical protein
MSTLTEKQAPRTPLLLELKRQKTRWPKVPVETLGWAKPVKKQSKSPNLTIDREICQSPVGSQMPRPQVPRQENKVNNNIKVEMEKRLLSHQLDVSGGSKRPTRNLYQMNQTLNIQWKWHRKNLKGKRLNGHQKIAMKQSQNAHPNQKSIK